MCNVNLDQGYWIAHMWVWFHETADILHMVDSVWDIALTLALDVMAILTMKSTFHLNNTAFL